jgi:hypothetical protein
MEEVVVESKQKLVELEKEAVSKGQPFFIFRGRFVHKMM